MSRFHPKRSHVILVTCSAEKARCGRGGTKNQTEKIVRINRNEEKWAFSRSLSIPWNAGLAGSGFDSELSRAVKMNEARSKRVNKHTQIIVSPDGGLPSCPTFQLCLAPRAWPTPCMASVGPSTSSSGIVHFAGVQLQVCSATGRLFSSILEDMHQYKSEKISFIIYASYFYTERMIGREVGTYWGATNISSPYCSLKRQI